MTPSVFAPVPLPSTAPGGDNRAEIADGIAAWVSSPAMTALLDEFGCGPLPTGSLAERLRALESFSVRWDYRKGGLERHQAAGESFPAAADSRIRSAALSLGLADRSTPLGQRYDHILVLGGGVRTMMARAELTTTILRQGISATSVAGLGSLRELGKQGEDARQLGLGECPTEGDAVDEALRHAFGATRPTDRWSGRTAAGQPWWLRSYLDKQPPVHVLAAPSTRPGQRANTADTLTGWAELVQSPRVGSRLLLITTDIFVPFQHCDAVRLLGLPYGCAVETVGFDSTANPWVPQAKTFGILQEVRSAIRSMQALHQAVAAE